MAISQYGNKTTHDSILCHDAHGKGDPEGLFMLPTGTFMDTLSWSPAGKSPGGHFIGLQTPQRALMLFYSMEMNPRWDQFIVFCPLEGHFLPSGETPQRAVYHI